MNNLSQEYKNEIEKVMGEIEAKKYFSCIDEPAKRGLSVNNIKISLNDFLNINNYKISQLPFNENCFELLDNVKLGKDFLHRSGAIYMQEPSAMIPGLILPLKEGDKVLDLCASPGGKTFQIARRLNGVVMSNEVDFQRAKVLQENIERTGLKNVIVSSFSSEQLGKVYAERFDAMIVDAPCSGEGMFRREEKAISQWSRGLVKNCAKIQKEILLNAINCLKLGGYLVYSTCTFSLDENEEIVAFLVKNGFEIKSIPDIYGGVDGVKIDGFDTIKCKRFYPQNGIGEGQFVCLLRKINGENPISNKKLHFNLKLSEENIIKEFFIVNFCHDFWERIKPNLLVKQDSVFYCPDKSLILDEKKVLSYGVKLGIIIKNRFEPSFNLFTAFGKFCKIQITLTKDEMENYYKGNSISTNVSGKGWCSLLYNNLILGGGKLVDGVIKNHYPKGLR